MAFLIVKYIHILAAIVAVGLNISYAVWIIRAQRDPGHVPFTLKGIKFLDDRIANPAYGVLLLTGLLMVFLAGYSFTRLAKRGQIVGQALGAIVLVILAMMVFKPSL